MMYIALLVAIIVCYSNMDMNIICSTWLRVFASVVNFILLQFRYFSDSLYTLSLEVTVNPFNLAFSHLKLTSI